MTLEDFVKWLEVKSSKYIASGAWHDCIETLIEEFKKEWMAISGEVGE
jgi:hypothetical protein